MIYRAYCSCNSTKTYFSRQAIFIDAIDGQQAIRKFEAILSNVWSVPINELKIEDVRSETELLASSNGEKNLKGVGLVTFDWNNGVPVYVKFNEVQFLCSPLSASKLTMLLLQAHAPKMATHER